MNTFYFCRILWWKVNHYKYIHCHFWSIYCILDS